MIEEVVLGGGLVVLILGIPAYFAINHRDPEIYEPWLRRFLLAGVTWMGALVALDLWQGAWLILCFHLFLFAVNAWNYEFSKRRRRYWAEQRAYWQMILENFSAPEDSA